MQSIMDSIASIGEADDTLDESVVCCVRSTRIPCLDHRIKSVFARTRSIVLGNGDAEFAQSWTGDKDEERLLCASPERKVG